MTHPYPFSPATQEAIDRALVAPQLQVKPEYRPDDILPHGQVIHLTNKAVSASEHFPHQCTAGLSSICDEGAREWLTHQVGELGVKWTVVPQYPKDTEDTFFFETKEHAIWFKLSFA